MDERGVYSLWSTEEQWGTRAPNKGPGAKEKVEKIHSAGNRHDCSREEHSGIQSDLI